VNVYFQYVLYLYRALLVGWNGRKTNSKDVIFTTMYRGKLRIFPFCMPLFIIYYFVNAVFAL